MKELRERAMVKRHLLNQKQYNTHSRQLQELQVGELVQVQNQEGSYLRRWTKTRRVVKTMSNRQHHTWLDGSGRVTVHNCQFLCKILLVVDTLDYSPKQPPPQRPRPINSKPLGDTPELMEVDATDDDEMMVDHHTTDMEVEENQHLIIHPPASPILRRSMKITWPLKPLSSQMQGPTHDYLESSQPVTTKCWHCGHGSGGHVERKDNH